MKNTVILIPAYKPEEKMLELLAVLAGYMKTAEEEQKTEPAVSQEDQEDTDQIRGIVVVDDGGQEPYAQLFEKAQALGCLVVHHEVNRGKGAAIRTGIQAAVDRFGPEIRIVTADADGQHLPEDILHVAQVLSEEAGKKKPALVLGVRDFSGGDGAKVPMRSRLGNRITSAFFLFTTGKACRDTQTGLRGIPAALLPMALATEGNRYEYEMNFLTAAVRKYRLVQVPIRTVYEDGNHTSHFRPVRDSLLIYRKPIRYVAVGAGSAVVDWSVFLVMLRLFGISAFRAGASAAVYAAGSTVASEAAAAAAAEAAAETVERAGASGLSAAVARICSGIFNFECNRHWSFQSGGHAGREVVRYIILFGANLLCNAGIVSAATLVAIPAAPAKFVADVALFVVNYQVQKHWVFRKPVNR